MNKQTGASLLIAGCCIGAGMLGIPVITGEAGFFPSAIMFFVAWLFMMATGIVLSEVVLSFGNTEVNLISMAEGCLGKAGKYATWILFSLLFYTIMIAYTIAGSVLISEFVSLLFGVQLPFYLSSLCLTILLLIIIARSDALVDYFNRLLMAGLLLSYVLLLFVGAPHVELERLLRMDFTASFVSLPILVISFGFQNLIPSLSRYLNKDSRALKKSIMIGSFLPLLVYLAWEFVILGIIPYEGVKLWKQAESQGEIITQVLVQAHGNPSIVRVSSSFAFFAIATSFLPVAFSFVDFLQDGLQITKTRKNRFFTTVCVLVPPLLIALCNPTIFLSALSFAGGIFAVILFGFLPVLMAYMRAQDEKYKSYFVFAKRGMLVVLIIASFAILTIEILHTIGKL